MNSAILCFVSIAILVSVTTAEEGSVSVTNSGGYVAFLEVEYILNGEKKNIKSKDYTLGSTETTTIPDGATNIVVSAQNYWFPGASKIIFSKQYSTPPNECFKVWGTALDPKYDSITC
ncbi:unnamed protein product [Bemisia tabaci]|uniref:Uncharacterized protein n=1 Tax=Bemisia tabaci TaxID=7038 RepID=A0A9P0F972_BEMTA|nr:unnamed protein product [Bemisia tabaci]